MRGIRAKMIRKHLAKHFPKEKLTIVITKRGQPFIDTLRSSANSFQRNYKDAKRAVA